MRHVIARDLYKAEKGESVAGHKYLRRTPDGKGGWRYAYETTTAAKKGKAEERGTGTHVRRVEFDPKYGEGTFSDMNGHTHDLVGSDSTDPHPGVYLRKKRSRDSVSFRSFYVGPANMSPRQALDAAHNAWRNEADNPYHPAEVTPVVFTHPTESGTFSYKVVHPDGGVTGPHAGERYDTKEAAAAEAKLHYRGDLKQHVKVKHVASEEKAKHGARHASDSAMQKSDGHKYVKREPDGKGSWRYFYADDEHIGYGAVLGHNEPSERRPTIKPPPEEKPAEGMAQSYEVEAGHYADVHHEAGTVRLHSKVHGYDQTFHQGDVVRGRQGAQGTLRLVGHRTLVVAHPGTPASIHPIADFAKRNRPQATTAAAVINRAPPGGWTNADQVDQTAERARKDALVARVKEARESLASHPHAGKGWADLYKEQAAFERAVKPGHRVQVWRNGKRHEGVVVKNNLHSMRVELNEGGGQVTTPKFTGSDPNNRWRMDQGVAPHGLEDYSRAPLEAEQVKPRQRPRPQSATRTHSLGGKAVRHVLATAPGKERFADVHPGSHVILHGNDHSGASYTKTYRVGDSAEYGSYNLSYYGDITAIGPKTVTITETRGSNTVHKLSIERFESRNRDWSPEKAFARNSSWSD